MKTEEVQIDGETFTVNYHEHRRNVKNSCEEDGYSYDVVNYDIINVYDSEGNTVNFDLMKKNIIDELEKLG